MVNTSLTGDEGSSRELMWTKSSRLCFMIGSIDTLLYVMRRHRNDVIVDKPKLA